jgi:transcriptional regulator with XRE-family HTH domain
MANELTARQAIRVWLAQHDKTQRWLAGKLQITEPRMSDILSGQAAPSDDVRRRLAKLTGIDLATFAKVA